MTIPSLVSYALPARDSLPANRVDWRFDPARGALLIHDMQDYFVRFWGTDSALVREVERNTARVRDWCRRHGVPVFYTAQPAEQTPAERALLNDMWGPGLTAADPALAAIVPALRPDAGDVVLTKWRYSAFQRSDFEERLRAAGRDQLVICGIYAHIGVMMTAADAFMRDVQPFVVADAVADFSAERHRFALDYIATRCGSVIETRDLVADENLPLPTFAGLRARLSALTGIAEAEFDADENLVDYGLDSIRVMTLAGEWKAAGVDIGFDALARTPSLNGWWSLIAAQLSQRDARKAA
ncbi:MAG TPA: isochorismatase family protein [Tahibacter sp.]|uniref:isochorismatase family protein n=1 Tax=Tahibacter sp. TaxID=2056211 RepID=UPI002CF27ECC|nr:isochorismatase family protein [Tahibacter sp.]HSX61719.1 isochorismatase family protein [Tahibacter sp.]